MATGLLYIPFDLPIGLHSGKAAQLPEAKQVAVPPPSYPVSHATDAEPANTVEPVNTPCKIVGGPQSVIKSWVYGLQNT